MRQAGAALILAIALGAAPAAQAPGVILTYRAASEDDASSGRVRLDLATSRPARAVVWERACALGSRRDVDAPVEDADQFWTFRIELTKDAGGRPAARVRYRVVRASGPGPEQDRTIPLDGKASISIDAFSARTDCRYDRNQLAVSGG